MSESGGILGFLRREGWVRPFFKINRAARSPEFMYTVCWLSKDLTQRWDGSSNVDFFEAVSDAIARGPQKYVDKKVPEDVTA